MGLNTEQRRYIEDTAKPSLLRKYSLSNWENLNTYDSYKFINSLIKDGVMKNSLEYRRMFDGAPVDIIFRTLENLERLETKEVSRKEILDLPDATAAAIVELFDIEDMQEKLMEDIEEALLDDVDVDEPAGRGCGYGITFNNTEDTAKLISDFSQKLIDYCMNDVKVTTELREQLNLKQPEGNNIMSETQPAAVMTEGAILSTVEEVVRINGQDQSSYSETQLITLITNTEQKMAEMKKIKAKSKYVKQQIEGLKALIDEVTEILDDRVEEVE